MKTRGATPADVANALRGDQPVQKSVPTRPRSQSRPAPTTRVVAETVLVPVPVAPPPPAKPESTRVEIIKGGTRTEVKLPKDSARRDTMPPKN